MPKAIVLEKRGDTFHSSLQGKPEVWGAGTNPQAAIGNMVSGHLEEFGITEIKYPRLKHFIVNLASRNARQKERR